MLQYTNIQRHDNIPFTDYLKFEGYSHSFLKHERNGIAAEIEVTTQMKLGSMVDAILTDPENIDMKSEYYTAGRNIAKKIKDQFGQMFIHFEKQVSLTCELEYNGFKIKSKGRLDFGLPGHAVIDLKITKSKDVDTLINFMGYKNQVWHYCKMYGVSKGYIMIYSIPLNQTFIKYIDCSSNENEFWITKTMKFAA